MINNNEINKLLNEVRVAKSDFQKLNALTSLREIVEKEIIDLARRLKQ